MTTKSPSPSTIDWLLTRTGGVRGPWVVAVLARITNQLLLIAVLLCAGMAILDSTLSPWIWWVLGLSLAKALLRYLEHFAGHWVAFTMLTRMRTEFYDSLVPQAPAVAKGSGAAELSETATRDIDRVEVFFAHTVPPAASAVTVPLLAAAWTWIMLGPRPALIMLVASALMIGIPVLTRRWSWPAVQEIGASKARIAVHLGDSVQGIRPVEAFGAQSRRITEEGDLEDEVERPLRRVRRFAGAREAVLIALELLTLALLVVVPTGADLKVPVLSALVWIGLWAPLRGVDDFVDGLDDALESADRVRATIDAKPAVVDDANPRPDAARVGAVGGEMTVDEVVFHYPGASEPTLTGINLAVPGGQWSYLAGVSGSGKSTLAALLARGYDPARGAVRLDQTDLRSLPLAELRARVALVVQRPYLLHASLADNLRLSAPDALDEELIEALRSVDLDQWANEDGLAHEIAVDGGNLSGGQVQRVAIARALLGRPQVLILDEATSQIDEKTAEKVRAGVQAFAPGMTVLEISHQVDRVPDAAYVAVIDSGEVVETGPKGVLLGDDEGYLTRLAAR